mmetsp:Transcript_25552/g.58948  ORF Transcript_25552/g.58948 Transcript_25552/m.58948 type:complete len:116 (+) Transcript_25552:67-414(+)
MTEESPPLSTPKASAHRSSEANTLARAIVEGTTRDASERVCTVTKENVPTPSGRARVEVRRHNLWHRATYVVLVRAKKNGRSTVKTGFWRPNPCTTQILVQLRSDIKDYCPVRRR